MSFFSISRGDWMCVRGLSEDSITISMTIAYYELIMSSVCNEILSR